MHILWLVRTTLPQAAAACGLAGASDVSGSWPRCAPAPICT